MTGKKRTTATGTVYSFGASDETPKVVTQGTEHEMLDPSAVPATPEPPKAPTPEETEQHPATKPVGRHRAKKKS